MWHQVALDDGCGIDVCEWLKSRGLLDMINLGNEPGDAPLHYVVIGSQQLREAKARWMMANGADVNAVSGSNATIFLYACERRSLSFVQELAGKVTPDHLSMPSNYDNSPVQKPSVTRNPDYLPIVRMLILRGATVRPQDFPASAYYGDTHLARRRDLLASLEADLRLNDLILIGLVLGCGVHAPTTAPTFATTTTTATTKRVRTQRPDGGWSEPVSVPCEPRLVVTAAPTLRLSARTAARVENHLPKLRGFRNSEVRMAIAGFLGVRPAAELGRLRAARDAVWVVLSSCIRLRSRRLLRGTTRHSAAILLRRSNATPGGDWGDGGGGSDGASGACPS